MDSTAFEVIIHLCMGLYLSHKKTPEEKSPGVCPLIRCSCRPRTAHGQRWGPLRVLPQEPPVLLRGMTHPLGWALLSGVFGLFFGLLCAPLYGFTGGWAFAVSWWISGIPYDLAHCAGNFLLALALFGPLRKLLNRLYQGIVRR